MNDLYKNQKRDMLEIAEQIQEQFGELGQLWSELNRLGYEDYKIEQELKSGYVGDTLSNLIDELPEMIERSLEDMSEEELEEEENKCAEDNYMKNNE